MKKLLKFSKEALFLAVLLLIMIFCFYSCRTENDGANNENSNQRAGPNDESGTEAADIDIPDNLPEADYGGYNFRIYIRDSEGRNKDFVAEDETGDVMNDVVYKRNITVAERFNIKMSFILYSDESGGAAKPSILAGDDAFDLIAMHGAHSFAFSQEGFAADWLTEMPYVDFNKPWWNDDITNGFTAFGKLQNVTGDISYLSFGSVMCLLFNKRLFQDLSVEYPYNDVLNGFWTLDKFSQISKLGTADLNGDGTMNPDNDRYGLFMPNEFGFPIGVLYCGGDRVMSLDEEKIPRLSLYNERTVDIFGKFFDLLDSQAACLGKVLLNITRYPKTETEVFKNGKALFLSACVEDIVKARDMEDEIGILPLPKYSDSTPGYYSPLEGGVNLFLVPITSPDLERTSIIIEALSAEGHKIIIPEYYERALKGKFIRDDESADMLDYIKNGIVYDYGYFNIALSGDELAQTGARLLASSSNDFTSFYERWKEAVNKNIEKMISNMK